ncbi:hypothetical protein ACJX0J_031995, partial [Zea mays]
ISVQYPPNISVHKFVLEILNLVIKELVLDFAYFIKKSLFSIHFKLKLSNATTARRDKNKYLPQNNIMTVRETLCKFALSH